jgi:hypothetical protein
MKVKIEDPNYIKDINYYSKTLCDSFKKLL